MHRTLALAFALCALAVTPAPSSARCAPPRHYAELLTPLDVPLPVGAHLVVAVRSGYEPRGARVSRTPDYRGVSVDGVFVVAAETRTALRGEHIGGGLFRMIPERPLAAGRYTLVGFGPAPVEGAPEPTRELIIGGELPPSSPIVSVTAARARRSSEGESRWGERFAYRSTFTLDRAIPRGIIAAMLVTQSGAIVTSAREGMRELTANGAYGGTHCGDGSVPGLVRPESGASLHLVLVDSAGRVVTSTRTVRID